MNFTDNVNNTSQGKRGDYWFNEFTNLTASAPLAERHKLMFGTAFGLTQHPDRPNLDTVTPLNFNATLALDFDPLKIALSERFSYQSVALDQLFAAGTARVDTYQNIVGVDASYRLRPVTFGLNYFHSDLWYGDTNGQEIFNPEPSSRDLLVLAVNSTEGIRLPYGFRGRAGLSWTTNILDGESTDTLRGNVGVSGAITPNLDLDVGTVFSITGPTYYRSAIRFHSSLAQKLKYSATLGAVVTDSRVSSKKVVSAIISTNIDFQDKLEFPPRTTHSFSLNVTPRDVTVIEQAQSGISYSDSYSVGYRVRHALTERVAVSLDADYKHIRTYGAPTDETVSFWTVSASTGYQVTKKFNVSFNYRFSSRASDLGPSREFDRNDFSLTGTYVF